jgi:hypothetical protein
MENLPEALEADHEAMRLLPDPAYAYLCFGCALHEQKACPCKAIVEKEAPGHPPRKSPHLDTITGPITLITLVQHGGWSI